MGQWNVRVIRRMGQVETKRSWAREGAGRVDDEGTGGGDYVFGCSILGSKWGRLGWGFWNDADSQKRPLKYLRIPCGYTSQRHSATAPTAPPSQPPSHSPQYSFSS
jgi:hypothetical protein